MTKNDSNSLFTIKRIPYQVCQIRFIRKQKQLTIDIEGMLTRIESSRIDDREIFKDQLQNRADGAFYEAKEQGKTSVLLYSTPLHEISPKFCQLVIDILQRDTSNLSRSNLQ